MLVEVARLRRRHLLYTGLPQPGSAQTRPSWRRSGDQRRAIASKAYRGLRRDSSAEPQPSPSLQLLPSDRVRSSYDAISKLNIIDNVAKVTWCVLRAPGIEPPAIAGVQVPSQHAGGADGGGRGAWRHCHRVLARTLRARMARLRAGEIQEALQLFGEVIANERLARESASDARSREAFIRAAEILGHHAELRGDTSAADQLYRRILKLGGNGIVARRLLLMLWRQGRLREAAELAPRIMQSDANLAQHLRGSDAVNDLTRRLKRKACGELTTRGQNARDFGLQVG